MISKKKSTRAAALKALFVLPLTAFAIVAFASDEVTSKMEVISSVKITDFIQNDTIKKAVKTVTVTNKSDDKNSKEIKSSYSFTFDPKDTTQKEITVLSSGKTGDESEERIFITSFSRTQVKDSTRTLHWDTKNAPLVIINGKESSQEIAFAIDQNHIKERTFIRGGKATELYGEKGKNGVIILTLKNPSEMIEPGLAYKNLKLEDALYIVDKEVKENFKIESLNPADIKNINIMKGDAAIRLYGDKAKNGVIMITTKSPSEGVIITREVGSMETNFKNGPLYVVDGVVVVVKDSMNVKNLKPESIKSVSVLKGESAVRTYGEKGKNGVINITLKDPSDKGTIVIRGTGSRLSKDSPLFVIDGVVSDDSLAKSLNAETIKSMNILKGDAAVKKYGEKAKNGVIEISSKSK
jgi:TonB-dependent SusC/RagA subfamily outer membrane receptor